MSKHDISQFTTYRVDLFIINTYRFYRPTFCLIFILLPLLTALGGTAYTCFLTYSM